MMTNLDVVKNLENWSRFLSQIRRFFEERQFLEVQTPTLVQCPGTEPYIDFYSTKHFFLPPSPEYSLKKILALTHRSVFEIRTCFRDELMSPHHRREFFMLEWYSVGIGFSDFQQQVIDFLSDTGRHWGFAQERYEVWRVDELFWNRLGLFLKPDTKADDLKEWCLKKGHHHVLDWDFDDLFHFLMVEYVQPFLDGKELVILSHYPPSQAALAQKDSDGWALRFEVFFRGIELGNAFEELQEVEEYLRRFEWENKKRKSLGRKEVPLDHHFIEAMKKGWPQGTCGIALGLERWFMLLCGQRHIHFWSPLFTGE
ncbi:MAG: hypothetical protein NZ480_09500 [Bdellovibrionaceae bacterium]|nr:hypothetical protein [Pseudobdellovibrionaceae bacterium]MDW8189866.1 amino acid--tRNA ligase-related protein [Pseudobdellovibrionaceae bacterium]